MLSMLSLNVVLVNSSPTYTRDVTPTLLASGREAENMLLEGYRERGELGKWLVVCGCLANGISDKKHYIYT